MRKLLLLIFILFFGANLALAALGEWVQLTTSYPTAKRLNGVYFLDEKTGYVVGNDYTIWKTTNRGFNWSPQTTEQVWHHLYGVKFPTSTTGYAVGEYGIYKTTDGGTIWSTAGAADIGYGLHFYDANRVWVAGYEPDWKGLIWKTTDGSIWNMIDSGFALNDILYDVYFSDTNIGCTVGYHSTDDIDIKGGIWNSIDGGDSWTLKISTTATLRGVHGFETKAWAVGDDGMVLRSIDGIFASWELSNTGIDPGVDLKDVYFINGDEGWAVGTGNNIYHTEDGADNWHPQPKPGGITDPLYAVNFVDGNNGWSVGGASNVILKYVVNPAITLSPSVMHVDSKGTIILNDTNSNLQAGLTLTVTRPAGSGFDYSYTHDSSSQITISATLSATATVGDWDIIVENPDTGIGSATFTVNPKPTITSVIPSHATQGETNKIIVITGTGFQTGIQTSGIVFSSTGITINSVTWNGPNSLIAYISVDSSAPTGSRSLTVTNPDGGSATKDEIFNINPAGVTPPTVTSVDPESGKQGEILNLTISGSNFHPSPLPTVKIGNEGVNVNSVSFVSSTSLTVNITITATAPTTARTVTVINNDDNGSGSLPNAFRVTDPGAVDPTVTSISPNQGYVGRTNLGIYISGNYFQNGAQVFFDDPLAINVNFVSPESSQALRINVSISSTATPGGLYDLTVLNPDGGSVTKNNIFQVLATDPKAKVRDKSTGKRIGLPYPNPWNPKDGPVDLQFYLTKDDLLKLTVRHSVDGILQEFLVNAKAGKNTISWDGITFTDTLPPNGMLLIIIESTTQNITLGKIKLVVTNKK
jgi:photosystem II stability/assembly factor-like uncharacterized protein